MAMNNILGLFAQSPLKPLQKHSKKVTECCDLLIPFFQHTYLKQWDEAEKVRLDISQGEREADGLKREIRLKLPRGLFLPIDRTDLLELVTQLDKLANFAKDHEALVIKAGIVEGKVLEVEEINEIAKLPGREGMYSMLLGMLQAPVSKFARVVKAVADAREENGGEAPVEAPAEEKVEEAAE